MSKQADGVRRLANSRLVAWGDQAAVIADMEALLIKALGLASNVYKMNFPSAREWYQVRSHEIEKTLGKIQT